VEHVSLETAAERLYADYRDDKELTAFTQLDCEDFCGAGHDIVKERKKLNLTNEEVMTGIMELQAENI
jgi:hypothetical protein